MQDLTAKSRLRVSAPEPPKAFAEWAWVSLFLLTVSAVIGWQNGLNHLELSLFDRMLWVEARPPSPDITLIGIDERSLKQLGPWPFDQGVERRFLQHLNALKPRAVGYLAPLGTGAPGPSEGEDAGEGVTASFDTLIASLHMTLNAGPFRSSSDAPAAATPNRLLSAAAAVGTDREVIDDDGVVRRVALTSDVRGERSALPNVMTAVAQTAGLSFELPGLRAATIDGGPTGTGDHWVLIPYSGPAGSYRIVPYVDVLEGRVPDGALTNQIVLVGRSSTNLITPRRAPQTLAEGLQRQYFLPLEIDAQVLAGLIEDRLITPFTPRANALACALPVALAMLVLMLYPRRALPLLIVLVLATLLAMTLLLRFGNLWFAPGGALAGLALALPIWRWRQLEGDAMRADQVLARINAAPDHFAEAGLPPLPATAGRVELRILSLARTVQRNTELRYFVEQLIDALPHAVLVTNADGHVVAANRAASNYFSSLGNNHIDGAQLPYLFGLLQLEGGTDGRSWWDMMDTSLAASHARARDARERDVLVGASLWHTASGELGGWVASIHDVSAIRGSERRRDEALRFMSQTLGAPQRSILAALDMLASDPSEAATLELHEAIRHHSQRTLVLTEKFIELSHAESRDYEFALCDVCDAIELAIDAVFAQAQQKNVQIVFKKPPAAINAEIDTLMISRAVSVLLGNAVRFSDAAARIEVDVLEHPSQTILRISDRGRGIAPLEQARMMRVLQDIQMPGPASSVQFGLGLSLVRTVVEKHRGHIEFTSNPGQGSEFRMVLPVPAPAPSAALSAHPERPAAL